MSEMYLRQRRFDRSIELAQEARRLAEANGILKNIAKAHWFEGQALAGIMQYDRAIEHLEMGVEIAEKIQHGSLRWKIRLRLAEAQREAGKSPVEIIQQARELIDWTIRSISGSPLQPAFLASSWIEELDQLEKSPTAKKTLYPAGLTQREVEVLQLVARGATNQQIADILHLSVRTVNTHMTNILNKTGCENRTAASAFAVEYNLVPSGLLAK